VNENNNNDILTNDSKLLVAPVRCVHYAYLISTVSSNNSLSGGKLRSLELSIFLYACETWTLTAELQRKILTMEMRCYRKILGISYKEHVTNDEVRRRIQQAIGPHDDLLTVVKKRKLRWYGHVSRSSGLAKMILQGTVKGARRRGRQRKRWEDNIREWTGLTFAESQRVVEDRTRWRGVVSGLRWRPNDSCSSHGTR